MRSPSPGRLRRPGRAPAARRHPPSRALFTDTEAARDRLIRPRPVRLAGGSMNGRASRPWPASCPRAYDGQQRRAAAGAREHGVEFDTGTPSRISRAQPDRALSHRPVQGARACEAGGRCGIPDQPGVKPRHIAPRSAIGFHHRQRAHCRRSARDRAFWGAWLEEVSRSGIRVLVCRLCQVAALSVSGHCPVPVHSAVGAQYRRVMAPGGGGRRERALVSGLAAAARIWRPAGRGGPARRRIAWRGRVPR